MASLQPVRGTHDLLFDDIRRHRAVETTAFEVAGRYGYSEIATPIFEFSEVFTRTLGDTSDIVTKEMYSFETKGGERVTLRPEGTAGVARAFISGGLAQQAPLRFFYAGPMFRHERPQKGRQRQFHQIGVELLGVAAPGADVEVIAVGHHILKELRIAGSITVEINSLGDSESRSVYRDTLTKYLSGHVDKLSVESKDRLSRNPLRVLDSKDPADKAVVADAPRYTDYLNTASKDFFRAVQDGLARLNIPFHINPALVRGLDYYSHTAFEFTTDALGAQGTVLAGGRYDGLIKQMGGPDTPGVGWAAGIERLSMLLPETPAARRPIAVIPFDAKYADVALETAQKLRHDGFVVEYAHSGNGGARLKRANKVNAIVAVLIGDDEMNAGVFTVRNLDSGEQNKVAQASLARELSSYR
jgi:histidyl-tRNA synthetase